MKQAGGIVPSTCQACSYYVANANDMQKGVCVLQLENKRHVTARESCGKFKFNQELLPGGILLTTQQKNATIDDRQRVFLMTLRQVLIMLLGGLEDLLELKRSIVKRKR